MQIVAGLILINIITYFLPYLVDFSNGRSDSFRSFLQLGWNSAPDIRDGEYYRVISSMFLHGDLAHLFVNMYSLQSVGLLVIKPQIFGVFGFTLIYFVSGICGSITSFVLHPSIPSVGASGAIMGLVGALLSFAVLEGQYSLLGNLAINIILIFAIGYFSGGRIDNWGHVGGLVSGIVVGFSLLTFR